jgi:hypothetical protein
MGRGVAESYSYASDKPPPWPSFLSPQQLVPPPPPPNHAPPILPDQRGQVRLAPNHAERRTRQKLVEQVADRPIQLPDDLGKSAISNARRLQRLGWNKFVSEYRGRSSINPSVDKLQHPAAPRLKHIQKHGVPVTLSTAPWSIEQKDAAVQRGCHLSAQQHSSFLRGEMLDMATRQQWVVLPYSAVRDLPNLRVSPPGVVPQRERRPRLIVDYTFSGVNADTVKLAPDSMQFGRSLQRILRTLHLADPRWGPVYLIKVDVADGFYQVWLSFAAALKLGLVLPRHDGDTDHLIAIPLALPMGWMESPLNFALHRKQQLTWLMLPFEPGKFSLHTVMMMWLR